MLVEISALIGCWTLPSFNNPHIRSIRDTKLFEIICAEIQSRNSSEVIKKFILENNV
jgi:hypothetical protein